MFAKFLMASSIAISAAAIWQQPSQANHHRPICQNDSGGKCEERRSYQCNDDNECKAKYKYECQGNINQCPPIRPVAPAPVPHTTIILPPPLPVVHPQINQQPIHPIRPINHPVQNQQASFQFSCSNDQDGTPTTFVQTPKGSFPVIRWVSDYFTANGYDPATRCRQVSDKFQQYADNGTLNYITTGIVNQQPVVCVSSTKGGACQGVLFTLKSDESASRTIQQLFDIRAGASGPLYESGDRIYFDMNQYLGRLTAW